MGLLSVEQGVPCMRTTQKGYSVQAQSECHQAAKLKFLLRLCQNQKNFEVFDFPGLLRSILTLKFSTLSDFPLVVYLFSSWSWYSLLYINDSGRLCEGCIGVWQNSWQFQCSCWDTFEFLLLRPLHPRTNDSTSPCTCTDYQILAFGEYFFRRVSPVDRVRIFQKRMLHEIVHDRTSTSYTNTYTMRHWQVQLTQVPNLFSQLVLESRAESSF